MKNMKKILALLVAIMMLAATALPVMAEDENEETFDAKVSVTGLANGDKVNFYQLVEWVGPQEDKTDVAGWKATSTYASILTKDKLTEILIGKDTATEADVTAGKAKKVGDLINPTGITAALAGQLAKVSATAVNSDPIVAAENKAELTVTKSGMYMALITPTDADTIYSPVFVSSDHVDGGSNTHPVTADASYGDEAAAKKSTVTLDKTASTSEDNWDDKKWQTAAIGDTISFTVTSKLPGYGEVYTNPSFVMKDVLNGLKLVKNSVTLVKPAGATANIEEADDGLSYTITFDGDYLRAQKVAQDIEVTYSAIVTKNSTLAVDWEKNEVSIEFSHTPTNESDKLVKKDTTQHYKFTIDGDINGTGDYKKGEKHSEVVKVGRDANGNPVTETVEHSAITEANTWESPLANAEFKLYTDAACTTEYVHKKDDGTVDGAKTYTSDANGRIQIANLDAGTYYLKETKAPEGYIMDLTAKKIVISATTEEKDITEYWNGTKWLTVAEYNALDADGKAACQSWTYKTDILTSYSVTIDDETVSTFNFTNDGKSTDIEFVDGGTVERPSPFTNTQGLQLPHTGGMGTTILYVGGSILVLAAAILLITKRRMNAED